MAKQTVEKEQYHTATMKTGWQIRYEDKSHKYWVRANEESEWIDVEFSMSAVADCLAKELTWWGMQVGCQGVATLIEQRFIVPSADGRIAVMGETQWEIPDRFNLEARLKAQKLTTNDVRDLAGKRGNSVHASLERWVADGTFPKVEFFPIEEQGYVRGLLAFLTDLSKGLKSKPESEIMVASLEHKVAGRYDLEAVLHDVELVVKPATPTWVEPELLQEGKKNHPSAKPAQRKVFDGRTLFDLKTSKGVYLSHKIQMTGYEGCRVECGLPPTKQQLVIRVGADGTYQAVECDTTWDEFLLVLAVARLTKAKGKR